MQTTFRWVPLAVLATAAAAAIVLGPVWSSFAASLPWLVALVAVGLPHGAADLAATRQLCGWSTTLRLSAAYIALMGVVVLAVLLMPKLTVALFTALSIWHFGLSHARAQSPPPGDWPRQALAALARGSSVLGVPLAVWPAETSAVVARLLTLLDMERTGVSPAFAPPTIRWAGLCLILTAMLALAIETGSSCNQAGALRRSVDTVVDLTVIGVLGAVADPLYSIGLYFLCWHAWREMGPLMEVIASPQNGVVRSPSIGPHLLTTRAVNLVRGLAAVHTAALPLLVPTWLALATGWWLLSPDHSPRDLAVLSLAVYVVVTPAHEALHGVLRARRPVAPRMECSTGIERC